MKKMENQRFCNFPGVTVAVYFSILLCIEALIEQLTTEFCIEPLCMWAMELEGYGTVVYVKGYGGVSAN